MLVRILCNNFNFVQVCFFIIKGNQTKIIKSSHQTASKNALIERYINRDVLFSSVILLIICLLCAGLSIHWDRSFGDGWRFVPFLLDDPYDGVAGRFFTNTLRFVILFQVMVPIALYVSLDLVRVLQMYAISRDKHLRYEHPISCRTFTINEDLGQIGYIFSDKTGTLTQNKLVFKAVSIGGIQYSKRYLFLYIIYYRYIFIYHSHFSFIVLNYHLKMIH